MIKYLLGLILAVNLFGQFDVTVRKLTATSTVQVENSGFKTGFTFPTTPPSGDLIWKLPNADAVGCLQSDGSFQLSIVACSGGSTLPVIDTTKIVKGSVDATKELRFEVDGFTTGTTNVLTPQDASYILAGTNITNTFTAQQITRDLIPSSAGSWNVGTVSDPYSTMVGVQYYARPAGGLCNYASMTGSVISGGLVAAQDTACAIQAQMSNAGFDTVNTVGAYKVQGTTVITAGRVLGGLTGLSSSLVPTSAGTLNLGASGSEFATAFINAIVSDTLAPKTSAGSLLGTTGARYETANLVNLTTTGTVRFGTSTTAGYVWTADASGFGTWQAASSGTALPVVDTTNVVKGSVDATKLVRFEVDGLTSGASRVLTVQDFDYTLAGTNIQNTFTDTQYVRALIPSADNTYDWGTSGTRIRTLNAMNSVLYSSASGITTVLSIPNATSSLAISVPSGGISSNTIVANTGVLNTSLSTTFIAITPLASTAPGGIRFYERAVNGTNFTSIESEDSAASNYVYLINDTGFRPGTNNAADLGTSGSRWRKLWTQDADVNGGLGVGGNASFSGNILASLEVKPLFDGLGKIGITTTRYGEGNFVTLRASTLTSTNGLNVGGSAINVIDSSGNLYPVSNFGSTQGTSSLRYNVHFGRFLNLRTNGSNLAAIAAYDNSNNQVFYIGDGGGIGGEFAVRNSALSEFFGAVNGQVRYNGANGLTSSFTCPAGEAVIQMGIQQGGVIAATCGVP